MSAISGILHLDGAPVDADIVTQMHQRLQHRGRDGQRLVIHHHVAFGHQKTIFNPEDTSADPPFESDYGLLTHHARLDNRAELIARLHLAPTATTSDILWQAYQTWGRACVDHLVGDFAFALWDAKHQQLFAARDAIGVRPFFYVYKPPYFAFATEMKALQTLPFVDNTSLHMDYLGYFLLRWRPPEGTTYLEDIRRLPGGSALVVGVEQPLTVWRWWNPDPDFETHYPREEDYIERFRELMQQAVTDRLKGPHRVGAQLSGGLDSSTVAAIANQYLDYPIPTFSGVTPSVPASDETAEVKQIAIHLNISSSLVRIDNVDLPTLLDEMYIHLDDPYIAPNLFMTWLSLQYAKSEGIGVMLTGHDGDTMIADGYFFLQELAMQGHFEAVQAELQALAAVRNFTPANRNTYYRVYVQSTLPWLRKHKRALQFVQTISFLRRMGVASWFHLLFNQAVKAGLLETFGQLSVVRRRRLRRFDSLFAPAFREYLLGLSDNTPVDVFRTEREAHIFLVQQPLVVLATDMIDPLAGGQHIEFRHPLTDRRLIEYCISLPPQIKLHDGWNRWILREGAAGWIPDSTRWHTKKSNLAPNFRQLMATHGEKLLDRALQSDHLNQYVQVDEIRRRYQSEPATFLSQHEMFIWATTILGAGFGS